MQTQSAIYPTKSNYPDFTLNEWAIAFNLVFESPLDQMTADDTFNEPMSD